MHDVDDLSAILAVLLEEVLDVLARGLDVLNLERALGVLVLGVDDDQNRILGAGRGGRDTGELAERLGLGHGIHSGEEVNEMGQRKGDEVYVQTREGVSVKRELGGNDTGPPCTEYSEVGAALSIALPLAYLAPAVGLSEP